MGCAHCRAVGELLRLSDPALTCYDAEKCCWRDQVPCAAPVDIAQYTTASTSVGFGLALAWTLTVAASRDLQACWAFAKVLSTLLLLGMSVVQRLLLQREWVNLQLVMLPVVAAA